MKKLILLLFVSASLLGQTRSQIQVQIDAIATGVPNTALKVRTILNTLANGTAQTGDVREIDVSNAYLNANFDVTGLGTNERLGWAICNGNNGTRNRGGRVALGYDSGLYPTLGAVGGDKDAVVVSHTHAAVTNTNINFGSGTSRTSRVTSTSTGAGVGIDPSITATGVSGTDKNLQPYIVTVFIMKL
jgi:hypothetical protein